MKNYLRSIRFRLNLPKDVRDRVMSDLESSVQARREAGLSDGAIMAEMGPAKAVAAELNEQMKEYAYRKSPWRFLFLALAVLSGGWLLLYKVLQRLGLLLNTLRISGNSASIAVIGSADGPTSIFVATTQGPDWEAVLVGAVLAVSILAFLRLRKCRQK